MLTLKNAFFVRFVGEKKEIIAEIFVDNISELPGAGDIDEYELAQGSVTYVIQSGELFIMDSTGTWYSTDGEAVS